MASMPPFHLDLTATDHATPVVQRLTQANQRLSQSIDAQGGFFTRNRRAMQQFGFQAGDVAVQIGGGQSAMLAFTQQGSQMLQFFGAGGALAGAFVAVVGSLAIALTRSGALTISAAGAMKRLNEHTDDATESLRELTKVQSDIKALEGLGLNSTVSALLALNRAVETDVLAEMREELNATTTALNDVVKVEGAVSGLAAAWERMKIGLSSVDLMADHQQLTELQERAQRATGAMQELEVALRGENPGLIVARLERLRTMIADLGEEGKSSAEAVRLLTPLIFERLESIGATLEKEREMNEQMEKNRKVLSDTLTIAKDLYQTAVDRVKVGWEQATAYERQKSQIVALYNTTSGLLHLENERRRAAAAQAKIDALGPQSSPQTGRGALGTTMAEWQNREVDEFNKKWEETQRTIKATGGAIGGGGGVTEQVKELTYELTQAGKEAETLANSISATIGSELLSMSDRTKTVADAFRTMARDIIKQLYDVLVIQRLVGSWSIDKNTGTGSGSGLMGLIMQGVGGLLGGSRMAVPSAAGGGYTGNGGRAGGLDGKGGFAAILHPRETVIDHTRGGEASVVQNITINAMSDGDIDRVLTKRMPQLKNAVLGAVRNERRRGALA